jgi:hypothetical protein
MSTSGFGGGEPLSGVHLLTPAPTSTINRIGTALDNLTLMVSNDITVLQQLTATNLMLMALLPLSQLPTRNLLKHWLRRGW